MFRLNLWPPRPFVGQPAPGHPFTRFPIMDNSFLQNPLTSPALMVLASTAEGAREGSHLHSPGCYPPDKDGPHVPFTSSSFMFRQGDPFPPSLQVHSPFLHPSLALLNAGAGAFRPLPHEENTGYHSAFTPAKRAKTDDGAPVAKSDTFHIKEERISSPGSSMSDHHSDALSEAGDERSTPDEAGRSLRKRKKSVPEGHLACPVCGLTIRKGELTSHLAQELDKLDKITRGKRCSSRDGAVSAGKGKVPCAPSTSRGSSSSPSQVDTTIQTRYENYLRVRSNRTSRLAVRSRARKRRSGDEAHCPVCNERLFGTADELNSHVEQCLKRKGGAVDVEDLNESDQFEEYTWAGQTRIRASTMLEGGLKGSGFATTSKMEDEDDVDLNVDGDESEQYGTCQYSEADVIPCNSDEEEAKERELLRGAVLGSSPSPAQRPEPLECTKWTNSGPDEHSEAVSSSDTAPARIRDTCSSTTEIIESLRSKLKYQAIECEKANKFKCLICMETYSTPLVSIQCWHVHCEECWLRTLGAKKLCPQCNMITSPGDLRKIYL